MDKKDLIIKLLQKQENILVKLTRPYIIVDVYPRRFINMLYFRIRNVGNAPAYKIKIDIEPPVTIRKKIYTEYEIFKRKIPVIGPKEEISFFFESAIDLFNRKNPTFSFKINVNYYDVDDNNYNETIESDIEILKDLSIELPTLDRVVDSLEHIQKDLEKISRYTDRLMQKQMEEESNRPEEEEPKRE